MRDLDTAPDVEAMLRELLERQRRSDARLEALEASVRLSTTPTPMGELRHPPASTDTVTLAKLQTPSMIPWPTREMPPLVTPGMKGTRSGGVIHTPPPRKLAMSEPGQPAVTFRPLSSAVYTAPVRTETTTSDVREREALEMRLGESEQRRRANEERLERAEQQVEELEEQLRNSRRLETVGRFVAGIAHDFNNLLTLICGNAELLRDGLAGNDRYHDAAEQVVAAGLSAAGLTRQLLSLARPDALDPQPLDLNEVIRGAERMIRRLVGEGLSLTVHLAPAVELVQADPVQVEQVLFNLAANARDAIGGGSGSVVIRTANAVIEPDRPGWPADLPTGNYVALTVSDTGCGMSDEVKSRLFEPFFTTKPGDKGTGLGLANVRDTMRQAGGHMEVETAVGWGTSIRLYWPRIESFVADPVCESAVVPLNTHMLGRGETVLLVEDDVAVRGLACVSLQQAGYRVLEAANADAAEERLRLFAGAVSLLVADVGLPGRDGGQLAAKLRAVRPNLCVLYVSGYAKPEPLPADATGEFLAKPFTPQQLLDTVRRMIGHDRQE